MSFQGSQSVYEGSGVATVRASLIRPYTIPTEIPLQINTIDGTECQRITSGLWAAFGCSSCFSMPKGVSLNYDDGYILKQALTI